MHWDTSVRPSHVHSLKATAGRFNLGGVEALVHGLEDRLDAIRNEGTAHEAVRESIRKSLVGLGEVVDLHRTVAGELLLLDEDKPRTWPTIPS